METEDERDYVTINPAVIPNRYNTVIMRWNSTSKEHEVLHCSHALTQSAAQALAKSWAAASRLEIR